MRKYIIPFFFITILFLTSCNTNTDITPSNNDIQEGDIVTFNVSYVELKNKARLARETQDISICEELPIFAEDIKNWCIDAIKFDTENILVTCRGPGCTESEVEITNDLINEKKYSFTFMKYNLDEKYCTDFELGKKQECYRFLAIASGNPDYCELIEEKDYTNSESIEDIDYKERCLKEVAIEIGDINLCNLSIESKRVTCIDSVASKTLNPSFCENSPNKDYCLGGIEAAKPRIHKKFLE